MLAGQEKLFDKLFWIARSLSGLTGLSILSRLFAGCGNLAWVRHAPFGSESEDDGQF